MINECHELKTALLILVKLGLLQVIKAFELQTEKGEFHLHIIIIACKFCMYDYLELGCSMLIHLCLYFSTILFINKLVINVCIKINGKCNYLVYWIFLLLCIKIEISFLLQNV